MLLHDALMGTEPFRALMCPGCFNTCQPPLAQRCVSRRDLKTKPKCKRWMQVELPLQEQLEGRQTAVLLQLIDAHYESQRIRVINDIDYADTLSLFV